MPILMPQGTPSASAMHQPAPANAQAGPSTSTSTSDLADEMTPAAAPEAPGGLRGLVQSALDSK